MLKHCDSLGRMCRNIEIRTALGQFVYPTVNIPAVKLDFLTQVSVRTDTPHDIQTVSQLLLRCVHNVIPMRFSSWSVNRVWSCLWKQLQPFISNPLISLNINQTKYSLLIRKLWSWVFAAIALSQVSSFLLLAVFTHSWANRPLGSHPADMTAEVMQTCSCRFLFFQWICEGFCLSLPLC